MKKIMLLLGTLFSSVILFATDFTENKKIEEIFKKEGVTGTFVLYDVKKNTLSGYNGERADTRYCPASTFKIFNSLIGLSEGAVKDVDETFYKYNGEKVFLQSWAQDSNLRYAIKVSQVPAYKELARRIGLEKMNKNIKKLNFGNMNIGNEVDKFWLVGPLEISAIEQTKLLADLAQKRLPYEKKYQEQVIDITTLEKTDNYILHGKTGWASDNIEMPIGWFVGWVEKNGEIYSFAINIDNKDSSLLPKRESIAREALKIMNILQ